MFICLYADHNNVQLHGIGATPDDAYNTGEFEVNDIPRAECVFYETKYEKPATIRIIPEQIVLV
jgi:hypothetical protein